MPKLWLHNGTLVIGSSGQLCYSDSCPCTGACSACTDYPPPATKTVRISGIVSAYNPGPNATYELTKESGSNCQWSLTVEFVADIWIDLVLVAKGSPDTANAEWDFGASVRTSGGTFCGDAEWIWIVNEDGSPFNCSTARTGGSLVGFVNYAGFEWTNFVAEMLA